MDNYLNTGICSICPETRVFSRFESHEIILKDKRKVIKEIVTKCVMFRPSVRKQIYEKIYSRICDNVQKR
jgi:hypothetical protein